MAILLVVLPNSTISDPSKPKTCPTLGWNHLADAPYRLSLGKAALHCHTGSTVRTDASAVWQSNTRGRCSPGPCGGWRQPRGRRVLSCSWSGTFFPPELHNPERNVHLPLFLLFHARRRRGVLLCCSYSVHRCDELTRNNTV
ncbi:unnamed protein product [Pipistrellus nathusii]|uniref:Secreted protein n=1 Tax=Pipistrellus nathusii TaxID=59473 RepID=A0ABP0A8V8_PIPNA